MRRPGFVAGFDSASAMLTATAAYLCGEPFPALGQPPVLESLARLTRLLPRTVREKLFIAGGALEAVSPRRVSRIDLDELCVWACRAYPRTRYPAVVIGSASGALVHLCAALGMPWLPQTFLVPVRSRVHPDDPTAAMRHGLRPGHALMAANPDWQLHHMHDANQDRLMVRALSYFRVKRRTLGPAYEQFLRERLVPGGTIVISDCRRTWHTTAVGERHVFQHGAVGGATQEEYHHGSPRVAEYLARYSSPVRRWHGPRPDTTSPEAEWGFAAPLGEDVERFARDHGYRLRRLTFAQPESPSPLVADLYRWWYRRRNIPADRLFIESFILLEPWWTLRTGSVPLWLTFNTERSRQAALRYLDRTEPFDEILLALFQHGVESVGLPTIAQWRQVPARARRTGRFAGMKVEDFPGDLGHLAAYDDALRRAPARYPLPDRLAPAEFEEFLAGTDGYEGVYWQDPAAPGSRPAAPRSGDRTGPVPFAHRTRAG